MDDATLIRSARFRAEREAALRHLEALVAKAEKRGLKTLSFAEARDLATLYRQVTSSLAIAREISLDKALLDYLEALTARAYLTVYAPQERLGGLLHRFLTRGAPRAMRASWRFVALAFLALGLGMLAGYLLFMENPDWFYVFVPEGMSGGRGPNASTEFLRDQIFSEDEATGAGLGAFAAFLFSHNTRIAFLAFGLGVFLAAPALLLTFYNGLTVGAFIALHVERGLGTELVGWLSIHGVTELAAVAIATGGGAKLGTALLFPRQMTRRAALFAASRDAVKLALVAGLMLVAAALLEGFGRQMVQDTGWRYAIGWSVGALWLAWFAFGGRRP